MNSEHTGTVESQEPNRAETFLFSLCTIVVCYSLSLLCLFGVSVRCLGFALSLSLSFYSVSLLILCCHVLSPTIRPQSPVFHFPPSISPFASFPN